MRLFLTTYPFDVIHLKMKLKTTCTFSVHHLSMQFEYWQYRNFKRNCNFMTGSVQNIRTITITSRIGSFVTTGYVTPDWAMKLHVIMLKWENHVYFFCQEKVVLIVSSVVFFLNQKILPSRIFFGFLWNPSRRYFNENRDIIYKLAIWRQQ